ncbi:LysR family transcriptional regulator [Tabrizicola sp.]|uniref:LysR family transcriptional regulator n=1 Tax=Tabrizicola sp. TaxID=2005166 RepID=UPI003F3AC0D4
MNLRSLDLNLLVILDVLLREGGVTGAAARLNLTQPAVSIALRRAREVFGDPLLVRSGAGMRPTPVAEALAPRLALALAEVSALFAERVFDPATASRDFVLATSDLAELLVLPGLVPQIAATAPGVNLMFRSVDSVPLSSSDAREGRIHLTIGGMPAPGAPFSDTTLFEDDFVVLARPGHPAFARPPSVETFAALPQALVSPQGRRPGGPIDTALAGYGLSRRIALSLTRFAALPAVLAQSDLVACVPRALIALPAFAGPAQAHPLPFASPRYALRMIWHRRYETDPAHVWLLGEVQASLGPTSRTTA